MSAIVLHAGPPPSLGWWPTSTSHATHSDPNVVEIVYRWWNGSFWSWPASADATAKFAAHRAGMRATHMGEYVRWCDRPADWPARSLT